MYLQDKEEEHGHDDEAKERGSLDENAIIGPIWHKEVLIKELAIVTRQILVLPAVEVDAQRDECDDEEREHRQEEAHEEAVVVEADAVVDPGTVVVEALDTPVADAAVARPVGADHFAVGAQQHWVKNLHHLHEWHTFWALEVARVFAKADHVQHKRHSKQDQLGIDESELVVVH